MDGDVATGEIVDFYVTSVNVIGESVPSDILTLYVAGVPSQPEFLGTPHESMVFPLTASNELMGVQVNWTEPSTNGAPITGYRLYMAEEQLTPVLIYDGS